MMSIHEAGHAVGAVAAGGHVTRVVLSPISFSRTDVAPNPAPLTVVWCGPLIGAALPCLLCAAVTLLRWPFRRWLKALSGFCLVANGLYLASGTVTPAGDTQELIRLGVPPPILCAVGVPLLISGLWLWHTLGRRWGLADAHPRQLHRWAWCTAGGLAAIATCMLLLA